MGPKITEPNKIPMGKMATRKLLFNSCDSNFVVSNGKIEPSVISVMPNKNKPMQAAVKTWFLLYMTKVLYFFNAK